MLYGYGCPEAIEFFAQLDKELGIEHKPKVEKEKKVNSEEKEYTEEFSMKEMRDIQNIRRVLKETEGLDVDNEFECHIYNEMFKELETV